MQKLRTCKSRERERKIVSWKTCKGKPPNDMRYVRSKMYMSIVLNLNENRLLQLLLNVALNAYYKLFNHERKHCLTKKKR